MQALVTGGTGFTGSALSRRLAELGHQVRILDQQHGLFDEDLRALGIEIHYGSVVDRLLVDRLMAGCELVFHVAAAFRTVNVGKRTYWETNIEGTRNVLEAARANGGSRVVNCSTCGVHGNVGKLPAAESAAIAPEDYYQATKWEAEKVAMAFAERGQWVTTLRPASIYGPGDPERFYHIYKRVAKGRFLFLGDGSASFHPLYIDNLVDAFVLAAESDVANGNSYLVADEEYLPIRDLVQRVAKALGTTCKMRYLPFWPAYALAAIVELIYRPLPAEPPIFRRRLNWFRFDRGFDISKAKRELGYVPKVGLDEGLRRTGEWYRGRGLL